MRRVFFAPVKIVANAPAPYPFASGAEPGTVILQVTIGKTGAIEAVKTLHDVPPFSRVAREAVHKWKFEPAMLEGKPVATTMVASFVFRFPGWWHRP